MSVIRTAFNRMVFKAYRKYETKKHTLNYLFWECTTRCNLSCLHCGSDCMSDSSFADMPFDHFHKAIQTIPIEKTEPITVVLTGGEPLMRNDIEECGLALRKMGFRWSMVSNGMAYTPERHNSLINSGMGALTISLDGMKDSHNWLRNHPNSFEKANMAIELAASSKRLNFDVVTCANRHNINELEEIYNHLLSKQVKAWRLFTIAPIGRAKALESQLMLSSEEFIQLMNFIEFKRSAKHQPMDVSFSCEGFVGKYETKVRQNQFFCRAGINIGSVLIDGSISACPNIHRGFKQGNIYSDNFYQIWSTQFQLFRNRAWMETGTCKNCNSLKQCLGNGFHHRIPDQEQVTTCYARKLKC